MVLPDSHEVSRASRYSGTGRALFGFRYEAFTRSGGPFQTASPAYSEITSAGPTTPRERIHTVWALPRSLAATEGVSFDFLSFGY